MKLDVQPIKTRQVPTIRWCVKVFGQPDALGSVTVLQQHIMTSDGPEWVDIPTVSADAETSEAA